MTTLIKTTIPITIITGFLGSGKTTLLNHILKQNHGKRIAVIENEFGEKNIDYEFVLHEKEQIYQMSNGCICCNVREDLIKTLKEIKSFQDKFDYIIIETTGLADPSPVLHTLKQDVEIAESFQIDSITCLIDSKNFLSQLERSPEVKKQITAANLVIINKQDLVEKERVLEIKNVITDLNPEAEVEDATQANLSIDKILDRKLFQLKTVVPKFIFKMKENKLHDSNVSSKFLEFEGEMNPHYFGVWIDLLFFQCADQLYRMKGILNFKGDDHKVLFQCVHDYIELTRGDPWGDDEKRLSQIVVIGKDLDHNLLESGFASCIK